MEYSLEDYSLIKLKCEAYKQKKREINKKRFITQQKMRSFGKINQYLFW